MNVIIIIIIIMIFDFIGAQEDVSNQIQSVIPA